MLTAATMTKADIRKRVALRASKISQDAAGRKVADQTDPAYTELDDAIRDGVERFWNHHQWAFASQVIQFSLNADGTGPLNIDADPSRYLLPDLVRSLPIDGKVYLRGPDLAAGWNVPVRHMDQVIERQFMHPSTSGIVQVCGAEFSSAIRPGLSERGGIEFRVWPAPGDDYEVAFRAMVGAVPLVNDNQRGNWPGAHDEAVIACAVAALFMHDRTPDSPERKAAEAHADAALAKSVEYDDEYMRPRVLGSIGESSAGFGARSAELIDLTTNETILSVTTFR